MMKLNILPRIKEIISRPIKALNAAIRRKNLKVRLFVVRRFLPQGVVAGWADRPLGGSKVVFGKVGDNLKIYEDRGIGGKN